MKTLPAWALVMALGFSAKAAPPPSVKNLTVEYQAEPLAVDNPAPRFSWEIASPGRGVRQTAYQIKVSEAGSQAVWDSGKVQSSDNVAVAYAGPALKSRQRYAWKVRVWDQEGQPSAESAAAAFGTGVLDPKDWVGQWIWEDDRVTPMDYAYFRTTLELPEAPAEAIALVSAHNFFTLFVNGKRVSGSVNPGSSNPYLHKLYLAYSIAPYLKKGINVIAAAAMYKGGVSANYVKATPGFLFDARIICADGSEVRVASGPDWKALPDTPYDEKAPFLTRRQHTPAEYFDARKEPVGWTDVGFDDSSWSPAKVVHPNFKLAAQMMPESGGDSIIQPVRETHPRPGVYVFDLGKEISGWARLNLSGPAGQAVQLRYSDRLLLGRVMRAVAEEPTRDYFDRYTLAGKGIETWQPQFGFRGYRYLEVTGFPGRPTADNVQGVFAHTLLKPTAEFESSNELLNKIYAISVHTQTMGMVGQLVDCVHREQSQWHADAEIESGGVFYTFFDPQIVRKTLLDLQDGQFEDGHLPANYPADPKWQSIIPEWDLRYFPLLWRTYFYYNDLDILKECWPAVQKLIRYFEGLRDASGLVKKHPAWHINDWPEFYATMDSKGKYLMVENSLYYQGLVLAAQMAEALRDGALAEQYRGSAASLKDAINQTFYDAPAHAYRDCSGSRKHHAGASVLALQFGIAPAAEREAVLAYVKSQGFSTSVVLAYNLIEMLYDNDQGEFAYSLVNRTDWPGWGYMVKKGSGTTWESWYNLVSLSHPFTSYWARFMLSGIVGIKPAAPGWKVIAVRPHPAGDLHWAKAKLQTAAGPVAAGWERTDEGFALSVTIPGNAEALVSLPLPAGNAFEIYEGEKLIWPQEGTEPDAALQFAGKDQGYLNFRVGSGQWNFRVVEADQTP
jgi:alpha-L-rhamnosidase